MPAVSTRDCIAEALRHSLSGQSKKASDDRTFATLSGTATGVLKTIIAYEEIDAKFAKKLLVKKLSTGLWDYRTCEQTENGKGALVDGSKKKLVKAMGPSLPEPAVTLYQPDKINLGWKGTFPVGAGMYNVGNTCYLNSTLQALFHVPALVNWLLSDSHHTSKCEQNDNGGECLTCAVAKTLQFSHEKSGSAIKPFYIYNKLKLICRTMVPGQQEDAHEFLRYLLEGMERAYLARHRATKLDSYSKETTPVNQIFGGYIRTEVKCLQCRHVSTTFQHFQDLLVDIRKASTLDEALTSYFSREQLDNNDYKCEACMRRVPATKQFSLERPPKVLCVQLKRFSVLGGKISRHIDFKQTIDMGPYLWREPNESPRHLNYKLMSMVTHMGPSVNCGHYTAVAQVSTGQYYSFDDSCVRSVTLSNVLNTNAYIMIFEMESQTQSQVYANQTPKVNGVNIPKIIPNGIFAKIPTKASTSGCNVGVDETTNGATKKFNDNSNVPAVISVAKNNATPAVQNSSNKSTKFIGPQLPARLLEKTQPRIVSPVKNGKVSNTSSLVPYDGSSDEEEVATSSTISNANKNGTATNGTNKILSVLAKESPVKINKQVVSSSTSSSKPQNGMSGNLATTGNGNGAIPVVASPVKQNGTRNDSNGRHGESNGKDKWHPIRAKTELGNDERVVTKALVSLNGWQISKDAPAPTCGSTPNGWSVTDNKEGKFSNQNTNNPAPSAAAPRNFNGTNRSETVSQLLKMSNRGYGTSSVLNWNGGRSHLDRQVDNERRKERRRHLDPEEEELDRGRTKKMKMNRDSYESGRSNPGYNPFQEYQNGKTWNRQQNGYHRKFYNTSRDNRPRGNGYNHNRSQHGHHQNRRHNNSRDMHWQRR